MSTGAEPLKRDASLEKTLLSGRNLGRRTR
jgi:hypothetical protein